MTAINDAFLRAARAKRNGDNDSFVEIIVTTAKQIDAARRNDPKSRYQEVPGRDHSRDLRFQS